MNSYYYIEENYKRIKNRISEMCLRLGRKEPTLVCVTKSAELDEIDALLSLGVSDIAENRVQMFLNRYEYIKENRPKMHLIGQLQSNKVKYICDKVEMIHSLDKLSLAKEINRIGEKIVRCVPCLIEINSGREENKGGVLPDEAEEFAASVSEMYPNVKLCGVMTMAPICDDKSDYLKYFSLTRDVFEKLSKYYNTDSPVLSMGMSQSYNEAIAEGATLVRIGRALFNKQ